MQSFARLGLAWCAWQLTAAGVTAQSVPQTEPAEYRAAVDEAVSDFAARRFDEARTMFTRAHALYPNARTLRGIGIAEFELRHYDECVNRLTEALGSEVRPLEGELRADTEAVLARALRYVARYTIRSQPDATELLVDGVRTPLPEAESLVLPSGAHSLELRASGYEPKRLELRVFGGEVEMLDVQFVPTPVAEAPTSVRIETKSARQDASARWYESPWLWIAAGVVVAGAGTGLAIALSREDKPAAIGGTTGIVLQGLWGR